MKRFISLMLVLAMLMSFSSALPAVGAIGEETHGYVLGDASDDGIVTAADVLIARRYTSGLIGEKDISALAADVNGDGDITMADVILIRQILVGIKNSEGNNISKTYKVDTVTIAGRNISRFTIVIPEGNECAENYAGVLRRYIDRACGIDLNITKNEDSVNGYKIKYMFDTEDKYNLGKEGYRVTVDENGDLLFYCGSMRGPVYVTYFFLEKLGFRFLTSDFTKYSEASGFQRTGSVEYLYEAENVNIPADFDETDVPYFSYRALAQGGATYENFASMGLNAVDGAGSRACAYARHGWGEGTVGDHAHSYGSQCEGIGWNKQPCLTDENTYNQIVEYNLKLLKDNESRGKYLGESYTQISCSPNDNTDFCSCPNCKAIYEAEGSIGGTVFRLSNRVAERLEQDYPGIEVFTVAYWDGRNPPKMTRPRENVCVCFCIGGCNNHTYDDVEACAENGGNERLPNETYSGDSVNSSNTDDMRYMKGWAELTENIFFWYYGASFGYYMAPSPNIFNVYHDFKYLASLGVRGAYAEGSTRSYYTFEWLRAYLETKMMWNPFMSEEEFNAYLNEYLMIYYGDGWQYIREYMEMANHAGDLQGCWTNNFDRPFEMYNREYMMENYGTMLALFEKAYDAAQTDEQKFRVEMCSMHCRFLGLSALYDSRYANGTAESRAEYEKDYTDFYNTVVKYKVRITSFDGDYDEYGCMNFPKGGEVINPVSWILKDFNGYWRWDAANGKWY